MLTISDCNTSASRKYIKPFHKNVEELTLSYRVIMNKKLVMTLSQFKVHSDSTENPALEGKWVTPTSGPAGSIL